jgi:hypothetical protein
VKWLLQLIRDFLDFDAMIGHRVSLVSLSGNLVKGSVGAVYQSENIGLDYFPNLNLYSVRYWVTIKQLPEMYIVDT